MYSLSWSPYAPTEDIFRRFAHARGKDVLLIGSCTKAEVKCCAESALMGWPQDDRLNIARQQRILGMSFVSDPGVQKVRHGAVRVHDDASHRQAG